MFFYLINIKIMKSFRVLVYLRKFVTKDFARFQFVRRWSTITNFVMIKKKYNEKACPNKLSYSYEIFQQSFIL